MSQFLAETRKAFAAGIAAAAAVLATKGLNSTAYAEAAGAFVAAALLVYLVPNAAPKAKA